IREKNRLVMVFEGFYSMVLRDFNRSLLLDLRALVENRADTHNMRTLIDELLKWVEANRDNSTLAETVQLTKLLSNNLDDPLAKTVITLAGSQAAHRSIK